MNSKEKRMRTFAIGYMVKLALNFNMVLRYQVETFWKKHIIKVPYLVYNVMNKENTCVLLIVMLMRTEHRIQRKFLGC